ncbi:MAG: T9SS type A sorting domain-containing protein [Sphingobacteriales bacterium]|nr:MAG: T9SS type A sorting domain-containing protein [Sphingobacteriales bacterium]
MKKAIIICYFLTLFLELQGQNIEFTYFNKIYGGNDTINILAQVVQPVGEMYYVLGSYTLSTHRAFYVQLIDNIGEVKWIKEFEIGEVGSIANLGVIEWGALALREVTGLAVTYRKGDDICLTKLNYEGNVIFTQTFGQIGKQTPQQIIHTNDGGYIIAGRELVVTADTVKAYALKIDSEGNFEWDKRYLMGNDARFFTVQHTPWDGGYIFGGMGYSTTTGYDMFVVKTLANGDTLWTKRYGGEYNDCAALVVPITTLEEFETGMSIEYVLTACWKESSLIFDRRFYIAKLNETGNIIWSKKYNTYEAMPGLQTFPIVKSDKGIIGATGFTNSNGRKEAVVFSFKSNGTIEWSKTFTIDPQKDCYLKDLQPTPDGGYVLAGYQYSSPQTAWVLKIDSLGNTCSYVGCDSTIVVEVMPGITSNSSPEISAMVYPVPASTYLNIRYQIPSGILPSGNAGWYLYDITGRQVASTTLTGNNGIEEISVAHLPAGIYYYRVLLPLSGQAVASGKILVSEK